MVAHRFTLDRIVVPGGTKNRLRENLAAYKAEHAERLSPAERGAKFVVPALMANVQGELELADTDLLMEHSDWSLLDHSAQLDVGEFDVRETANRFEIDIDGQHLNLHSRTVDQFVLAVDVEGSSESGLVLFLAKQVRESDLSPTELIAWLTRALLVNS